MSEFNLIISVVWVFLRDVIQFLKEGKRDPDFYAGLVYFSLFTFVALYFSLGVYDLVLSGATLFLSGAKLFFGQDLALLVSLAKLLPLAVDVFSDYYIKRKVTLSPSTRKSAVAMGFLRALVVFFASQLILFGLGVIMSVSGIVAVRRF